MERSPAVTMAGESSSPHDNDHLCEGQNNPAMDASPTSGNQIVHDGDIAIRTSRKEFGDVNPMAANISDGNETPVVERWPENTSSMTARKLTQAAKGKVKEAAAMDNIILRLNNHLDPLNSGDTYVYFGIPPQAMGQSRQAYDVVQEHFKLLQRVDSAKLKSLNSSKFNTLLGPRSIRTKKRFHKLGLLGPTPNNEVGLFLDLQPPLEDEDAVILVTELTCTRGVLNWHKAGKKYGIARTLIGGEDDSSLLPLQLGAYAERSGKDGDDGKQPSAAERQSIGGITTPAVKNTESEFKDSSVIKQEKDQDIGQGSTTVTNEQDKKPALSPTLREAATQPEYSQLRHCSAIERLLNAIVHKDPKLDSAPKVWTYFAVAKYFDCATHERVNGWITRWLYSNPNHHFIQCNPEVTYRIGLGINSEAVTKDAFAILVGEKALLNVLRESDPSMPALSKHSVHGRTLELLDDDERNRIDHAAASLVKRVRASFESLIDDEMSWLQGSRQYMKLSYIVPRSGEEAEIINGTKEVVKHYVRNKILQGFRQIPHEKFVELKASLETVKDSFQGMASSFDDTFQSLSGDQRIFTRTFWLILQNEHTMDAWQASIKSSKTLEGNSAWDMIVSHLTGQKGQGRISAGDVLIEVIKRFNRVRNRHATADHVNENGCKPLPTISSPIHVAPAPLEVSQSKESGDTRIDDELEDLFALSPKRTKQSPPLPQSSEKQRRLSHVGMTLAKGASSSAANMNVLPPTAESTGQDFSTQNSRPGSKVAEDRKGWQSSLDPMGYSTSPSQTDIGGQNTDYPLQPSPEIAHKNVEHVAVEETPTPPTRQQPFIPGYYKPVACSPLANKQGVADLQYENSPPLRRLDSDSDATAWNPDLHVKNDSFGHASAQGQNTAAPSLVSSGNLNGPRDVNLHQSYCSCHPEGPTTDELLASVTFLMRKECEKMIYPAHLYHEDDVIPTNLVDTLMCLEDAEWKYLPLWAGGCDDGTGGVFDEVDVPNLEAGGFTGGKRGISSVNGPDSSASISEFSDIASEAVSTVGRASKDATDGTQTVKSYSDTGSETSFMNQDGLWNHILVLKNALEAPNPINATGTGDHGGLVDCGVGDFKGKGKGTVERAPEPISFNLAVRTINNASVGDEAMGSDENNHDDESDDDGLEQGADVETVVGADSTHDEDPMSEMDLCGSEDEDNDLEMIDKDDL